MTLPGRLPSSMVTTKRLWTLVDTLPDLRAVFLEASFPNSLRTLADVSQHLTPERFAVEAQRIPAEARIIAVHIKARYRDTIVRELQALGCPNLEIGECEKDYFF